MGSGMAENLFVNVWDLFFFNINEHLFVWKQISTN